MAGCILFSFCALFLAAAKMERPFVSFIRPPILFFHFRSLFLSFIFRRKLKSKNGGGNGRRQKFNGRKKNRRRNKKYFRPLIFFYSRRLFLSFPRLFLASAKMERPSFYLYFYFRHFYFSGPKLKQKKQNKYGPKNKEKMAAAFILPAISFFWRINFLAGKNKRPIFQRRRNYNGAYFWPNRNGNKKSGPKIIFSADNKII